jgi:long-chain acyl-CoA synthetase
MTRLPDIIRLTAERHPNALALAPAPSPTGAWSYGQLWALVQGGAAVLRAASLTPGDRVLLFLEPRAAWPVAFFSILEAGLVAVPLPAETPLAAAAGVAARAKAPVAIVGIRTRGLAASNSLRCLPVEQLIQLGEAPKVAPVGPLPELAALAFTSGSTTQPRAVELTHANLLANLQAALRLRQAAPGDSFLSMLPPAHLFELLGGLLGPLACGARIVYAPSLLPNRILAALRDERITHALSVPALLQVLYEEVVSELVDAGVLDPAQRDQTLAETARRLRDEMDEQARERLSTSVRERIGNFLRMLLVGGAALDPAWVEITAAVGLHLEVGYGLTEASPIVSAGLASECPPGSSGRPLPGVEVRIGDDREILVRGPNVMRGYYRDAESTAAVLKDGWLHTGDHGRLDADGFLFVTGRIKEALVTAAGETLYPEDVEPYYASPLFAEHCVTGLPGPQGNDVPTLFVVPAAPDTGDKELRRAFDDLRAAAPARFRVAGMVRVAGPLPRTALGKVRRRFLAQQIQTRGNLP